METIHYFWRSENENQTAFAYGPNSTDNLCCPTGTGHSLSVTGIILTALSGFGSLIV